jgi:hypothetical protein
LLQRCFLFIFISNTYIIKSSIYLFPKFLSFRAIFCCINPDDPPPIKPD